MMKKRNPFNLNRFIGRRHSGGINSAWLDGHVEHRKGVKMAGKTDTKWRVAGHFCCYYYMISPGE